MVNFLKKEDGPTAVEVRRDAGPHRGGLHRRDHDPRQQCELDVQLRRLVDSAPGVVLVQQQLIEIDVSPGVVLHAARHRIAGFASRAEPSGSARSTKRGTTDYAI